MNDTMKAHDLFDKHIWSDYDYFAPNIKVRQCFCGKHHIKQTDNFQQYIDIIKHAMDFELIPIGTPKEDIIITKELTLVDVARIIAEPLKHIA